MAEAQQDVKGLAHKFENQQGAGNSPTPIPLTRQKSPQAGYIQRDGGPKIRNEHESLRLIEPSVVQRRTKLFDNEDNSSRLGDGKCESPVSPNDPLPPKKTVTPLPSKPPLPTKKPSGPSSQQTQGKPRVISPKPKLVTNDTKNPETHPAKLIIPKVTKNSECNTDEQENISPYSSTAQFSKNFHSSHNGSKPGETISKRIAYMEGKSKEENSNPMYSQVDIGMKKKAREARLFQTAISVRTDPDLDDSVGGEYAILREEIPDPKSPKMQLVHVHSQGSSEISVPPKKPPRTFEHDDYMAQKELKRHHRTGVHPELKATVHSKVSQKISETGKQGSGTDMDNHISMKAKTIHRTGSSTASDSPFSIPRPVQRPPPPPRPPPPSPKAQAESTSPNWHDKPQVRVLRHNENLPRQAFLKKGKITNPSYEADWDIIKIKAPSGASSQSGSPILKRYHSDECLYSEPVKFPQFDEPIYIDPMDMAGNSSAVRGFHENRSDVMVDSEGYAVPDTHPPLHRQHTLRDGHAGRMKYETMRPGGGSHYVKHNKNCAPPLKVRGRKRPQVQEKLSTAYSVLRVGTPVSGDGYADDSDNEVDPTEHEKRLQYVSTVKLQMSKAKQKSTEEQPMQLQLFTYAAIIGLEPIVDTNRFTSKVLFHFPQQEPKKLEMISLFCFPDLQVWRPVTRYKSETFSFVLTDHLANRHYGYCKRLLPPGSGNRLPIVFCIISNLDAFGFYEKLLHEIKQKYKLSMDHTEMLIQAAFSKPLPEPGQEAWVSSMGANEKKETVFLKRPVDTRRENVSFATLLSCLSVDNLLCVFASVLLERKIIFVAQHLSTLTSCIHALCSLLYPFAWPHPFVPVLPEKMIEVCQSPTPIIVGVLTTVQPRLADLSLDESLMIDLDHNSLMRSQGDEPRILPKKLQKALRLALKEDGDSNNRDIIVMESFLRFFVETTGHYTEYVCTQMDGAKIFEKKAFITSVSSKSIRLFLEWFVETQMFELFIRDRMEHEGTQGLFESRIIEYREEMKETRDVIKRNMKEVGRKMINFFTETGGKLKKKFSSNVYI